MTATDLDDLLSFWELRLRAERKSAQTVKAYGDGVRAHLDRCARSGKPVSIDRRQLGEFVDELLTGGAQPGTAVSRLLALRRFSAGLTEGGEQGVDPLLGLRSAKLDEPVVEPLTDDQLRAMVKACRGPELWDKRDEAILRLMFSTGARAGEVVAIESGDLGGRAGSTCWRTPATGLASGANAGAASARLQQR